MVYFLFSKTLEDGKHLQPLKYGLIFPRGAGTIVSTFLKVVGDGRI